MLFAEVTSEKVNCLISHNSVVPKQHVICILISCTESLASTQLSQTDVNNFLII